MHRRLLAVLFLALTVRWGLAETFVVYPVQASDTLLGIAVADRIVRVLINEFDEVVGPEIAAHLAPPLAVGRGYLSPNGFLRDQSLSNPIGAALARESIGADLVLTGEVTNDFEGIMLKLYLAGTNGVRTFTVRAAENDPGMLIQKAVAIIAARLRLEMPDIGPGLVLSRAERGYLQVLDLISRGFLDEAQVLLTQIGWYPGVDRLRRNLAAVRANEMSDDPGLQAIMALNLTDFSEELAIKYFRAFAETTKLLAPQLWIGALSANVNDLDGAVKAFNVAAAQHPYGVVARANFRASRSLPGVEQDVSTVLGHVKDGFAGAGSLLGLAIVADQKADVALEQDVLEELTRVQPDFLYPYERLSFIAFDQEDFFGAQSALLRAVQLNPDSDLYWTNLGWSYYRLGLLGRSEEASVRANNLNPERFIALYNLGLVQTVTGRLELAIEHYGRAVSLDPAVDENAVLDLVAALKKYPDQPVIHYALGYLYEENGNRVGAADQYELYLKQTSESPFAVLAGKRILALRAPSPTIEINSSVKINLGAGGIPAAPYHPADTVYPEFEVFTEGETLPEKLNILLEALGGGDEILSWATGEVSVPRNAVGLVVSHFGLELPLSLEPGPYHLRIVVKASGQRLAEAVVEVIVEGGPVLLRQLISRNIKMVDMRVGRMLFGHRNLSHAELLPQILVQELRGAVEEAEEVLPDVEVGRFQGMSGGVLFANSTTEDVGDFLRFLLSQPIQDTTLAFVDAYAQWALDGSPQ
jgi:tetratricopeptide (TPR) repeat protein